MIRLLAVYFGNLKQLFAKNGNGKLLFHHRDTEFTEDYKFHLCCIPTFTSFAVVLLRVLRGSVVKCSCFSHFVLGKAVHAERVRTAFAFLDVSNYPQKRVRNQ